MDDAVYVLVKDFLKKENFKINFEELRLQLLSHPSYPSLHSVTGVLTHFNIINVALQLPVNSEVFDQLPKNFIGISNENEYLVVTKTSDMAQLFLESGVKKKVSKNSFLKSWNGLLVAVDSSEVDVVNITIGDNFMVRILGYTLLFCLLAYFLYSGPSTFQVLHFFLGLIGLSISTMILKHEFGYQSKALDKICSSSEASSCDAVLQSKGATFFKFLKLSDVSFIYFLGISMIWIFIINSDVGNNGIGIITLLTIPMIIYSIYYQYQVVKKWCPLCLGVVCILWLQIVSLFFIGEGVSSISWSLSDWRTLLFGFLISASGWLMIKPLIESIQAMKKFQIEHYKFKRNFDLFNAVLDKKPNLDITIPEIREKEIILGNNNAPLTILLITSPGCIHCKAAHSDLEYILSKNPDEVKVILRFSLYSKDKESSVYRVAARILQLYDLDSIEVIEKALHEAYAENADLEEWLEKWGDITTRSYDQILEIQQKWCHGNGINFTPSFYVNGKEFPSEYDRKDLSFFIEDLVEHNEIIIEEENLENTTLTSAETFL